METNKRTDSGTPYLSWCIIARNCEDTIEATLKSLRARTPQAEIVVVDTCSSDSTPDIAKKYADKFEVYKGPRGDWNEDMPFFDDAAAARQRSFEIASGLWRGWIDSDDRLPGPDETKELLTINNKYMPKIGAEKAVDTTDQATFLEDQLRDIEEQFPDIICIYAPYLYQRDEENRALLWQERERIVKWSDNWKWMEKAHEVLCPIDGTFGRRLDMPHLLFLHEKKFDQEAEIYALTRHFKVMNDQYQNGDRTTRRCLYLAAYAKYVCPEREAEFIDAAHHYAESRMDRYRAKLAEAEYYIQRGLYLDSVESLGAATDLYPAIPDAWIMGAKAALESEDWIRAKEWFEKGLELPVTMDSLLNPREMAIYFPVLLAGIYEKIASLYLKSGQLEGLDDLYGLAEARLQGVLESSPVVIERETAASLYRKLRNIRRGHKHITEIASLVEYLADNDEPAKAVEVIKAIPHTLEDHPITIELEQWAKKIITHIEDPDAYAKFYLESEETGLQIPSPEHLIQSDSAASKQWTARAYWAADIINKKNPKARILDIGCYDGLSAIPLLQMCPEATYVGIDMNEDAAQRFRERLEKYGLSDRATVIVSKHPEPYEVLANGMCYSFDFVTWFEVIEHVPHPPSTIRLIHQALNSDGQLLISTPWGAFDDGLPPGNEDGSRDSRGHLRAMTARDMRETIFDASNGLFNIEELYRHEMEMKNGADTMHVACSRQGFPARLLGAPIAFTVAAALWDWNSRSLHKGGMGASEETICYLAKSIDKDRDVNVYGPVGEEEVHHGVGYWPHEQMRHIEKGTKVVVSRAPSWGTTVDKVIGFETEKILWLQDAIYQDLNPEVAAQYEKIVCVGHWQMHEMNRLHGVPMEKMTVIGNFLMRDHFEVDDAPEREPHHFIYSSSPDRGLIPLLQLWPKVREIYPDATLDIFYGWRGINKLGSGVRSTNQWISRFEKMRRQYDGLRHQPGVNEKGMISHPEIAKEFMRASAWLYPTQFTETFCSNAVKSRAAGCVPVTSALAALNETAVCDQAILVAHDLPSAEYEKQWLDGVVQAVETSTEERAKMSKLAINNHSLEAVLPKWEELLR